MLGARGCLLAIMCAVYPTCTASSPRDTVCDYTGWGCVEPALEILQTTPAREGVVCDLGFAFARGPCDFEPRCVDFDYTRAAWIEESAALINTATAFHGTSLLDVTCPVPPPPPPVCVYNYEHATIHSDDASAPLVTAVLLAFLFAHARRRRRLSRWRTIREYRRWQRIQMMFARPLPGGYRRSVVKLRDIDLIRHYRSEARIMQFLRKLLLFRA